MKEDCNRLKRIINWIKDKYSEHFTVISVDILPIERDY